MLMDTWGCAQMRPAATASCNVYNNVTGNIAPGSVQIGATCCAHSGKLLTHRLCKHVLPTSCHMCASSFDKQPCIWIPQMTCWATSLIRGTYDPLTAIAGPVNGTGTQLSVAWNASARTATIVFKGSTTREDWITVREVV